MNRYLITLITIGSLVVVPSLASAAADDIVSCNKNSQATQSAGSRVPLGGPYVPVADYAVEENTGLLVYKECVLRVLANSKRRAALAPVDEQILTRFNGYPSRELGEEESLLADKTVLRYLENSAFSSFSDTLENRVKQAVARAYGSARDPRKSFECEYADKGGDLLSVYDGIPKGSYWDGFRAVVYDPSCVELFADARGYDAIMQQTAYEVYKNRERLTWGQGVYDVAHYDENGFRVTDTPGAIVLAQGIQSVQSSYKQAQEADDIGEMVSALYLGVSNQVLSPGTGTNPGGLTALTSALGGAASYMAQVVQGTTNDYTNETANELLNQLQGALSMEQAYKAAVTATAAIFTQTNTTLRTTESECYDKIAAAICQEGTVSSTSCSALGGGTLQITRTTDFSQKVIDTSTRALSNATISNINISIQIIARIGELISALRANPSLANQATVRAALAAIGPHTAQDRTAAVNNQTQISQQMATLLTNTSATWKENSDPSIGWCNTSVQEVKDKWTQCWSGNPSACPQP